MSCLYQIGAKAAAVLDLIPMDLLSRLSCGRESPGLRVMVGIPGLSAHLVDEEKMPLARIT